MSGMTEAEDRYFISLELAAGGNLASKIGGGRIREIQAISIMRYVAPRPHLRRVACDE